MPRSVGLYGASALLAVGLLLIGYGIVRAVLPTHADLPVFAREGGSSSVSGAGFRTTVTVDRPIHLDLPTLGVRAGAVPVAVGPGGELGVPEDPHVVGWWPAGGGTLVIDGHVDTAAAGPGALFRLAELIPGAGVQLTGADGVVQHYTVTAVRAYPKADLPLEVFGKTPTPRLVLISCGGHFDWTTHQYAANIVAYAEPV